MPGHRPTRGQLYLVAKGFGDREPVAVIAVPVKK
jgi:hypothetical protein